MSNVDELTEPAPTAPKSVSGFPHFPALDGVRGAAVAAVLVFHGGFAVASGGFLGVSTFFTLSGFLITSLLLAENEGSGTIALGAFWKRRFKRLLPAAIACIGAIAVFWSWLDLQKNEGFGGFDVVARIPGDLWAALFYVYNWRAAFPPEGAGYNSLFEEVVEPSPAAHFWSLSIEEQFYVFFPLLAAIVLAYLGRSKRVFGWVLLVLLAGSMASVFLLDGFDRIYNGTDVRAAEILIGALLAIAFSTPRGRALCTQNPAVRWLGLAALLASIFLWFDTTLTSGWLLEGGLAGYAVLSALIIAAATQASGPVVMALAWRPLRWLGAVSYGVYLYHWPIFRWVDHDSTGLESIPLFGVRMLITLALAWLSYHYLEQPIRRGTRPGAGVRPPAGLAVAAVFIASMTVAYSDIGREPAAEELSAEQATNLLPPAPNSSDPQTSVSGAQSSSDATSDLSDIEASVSPTTTEPEATLALAPRPPVMVVMGDSIAENLFEGLTRVAGDQQRPAPVRAWFPGCANARGGEIRWSDSVRPTCDTEYELLTGAIAENNADALVVVGSPVDLMAFRATPDEPFLDPTEPASQERLREAFTAIQNIGLQNGLSVVWVTVPCIEAAKAASLAIDRAAIEPLNRIIREVADAGPENVAVYDLFANVCFEDEFLNNLGGDTNARPDGLHFSDVISNALAQQLTTVVETVAPLATT